MNKQTKIQFLAFVIAAFVALSGLVTQPAHAYATGFNSPSGPHYHSDPVTLAALLAAPQGISTSPGGPRP
jgi:hypothetical protein